MKKSYIFALVIIGIAITIIISTAGDASSYVTFNQARSMAESGNDEHIHVVGKLKKNAQGEIVGLKQGPQKLSCSFILVDQSNEEQKVYYNEPMPSDLKRSEKVVVIGSYQKDTFVADKILLKCPSKYKKEETI